MQEDVIEILGAREHNLKDIDLSIPRNKLVVITGVSGSGKSSLAFDTIYAEGQRRYMESFSAYARAFIGGMERPDVDKINGLSPVISIEQKTTSKNPRSTVGTTTEIYDFLRLLYARAGEAFSYLSGEKMVKRSEEQIVSIILEEYFNKKIIILAPVVKGRKGHYRELFVQISKKGYTKVRVDGEIQDIEVGMQLDRYHTHDIEIVIDRIATKDEDKDRLRKSVRLALKEGKGMLMLQNHKDGKVRGFSKYLMCPTSGIAYSEPAPNLFSFNSPYGMCKKCSGFGKLEEISVDNIIPDRSISISRGAIAPLGEYRDIWIFKKIDAILKQFGQNISVPVNKMSDEVLNIILYGSPEEISVDSVKYPGKIWYTQYEGIISFLEKQKDSGTKDIKNWISDFTTVTDCDECKGGRLNKEAMSYRFGDKGISELCVMDINELSSWVDGVENLLSNTQLLIATPILKELRKRIGFLVNIGLEYLSLNRAMKTLSGGEAQRIRLATQIGSQLVGVLYILDEPSIGLHQRDNVKLIKALQELRDAGNSVIVVEHDKDMMLASDFLVDIGPGAGIHGGKIVAHGTPIDILKGDTTTVNYLKGSSGVKIPEKRRAGSGESLKIKGIKGNNLQNLNVEFPLGKFICVTGVSGSGKSTLIHDTLYPILAKHFYRSKRIPLPFKSIEGLELLDKVVEVDQSPIGRTPRSNPATYTGVFTDIRTLYAQLPESKIRGYKAGRFSFNVKGGRCEECQGGGKKVIEMEFLPSVHVDCESCKSKRYNRETLEVRFKGKSISDVLDMTVEDAIPFLKLIQK